jgi:hypothetical protein
VRNVFGGNKAVVRPDPIPNSAVKHSLADGSGFIDSARVGCRQSFLKAEMLNRISAFLFPDPGAGWDTFSLPGGSLWPASEWKVPSAE